VTYNAHLFTTEGKETTDLSFLASKKIVYLVNVDWFFISHRLPLARAARDAGAEVIVAAGDTGKGVTLEKEGIHFVPLPFSRQGTSIFQESITVHAIFNFLKRTKPDLLHTVSIKPVLYGSLLSRFFNAWPVVNAISGLGYVFSQKRKAAFLRHAVSRFYKMALGNPKSITIFQNPSDMEIMLNAGLIRKEQMVLIRGSGVDCSKFIPSPFPENPVIMLPARMLWDKGVAEFIRAAEILHPEFPNAKFVLVGPADDENPSAISCETITEWTASHSYLEWWGAKEPYEMPEVLAKTTIIALPSYHEGLPKVLLEAAACGRPIVTTDIPGCKEIVSHNTNGFLVPVHNAEALSHAMRLLLESHAKIEKMGQRGREIVCSDFIEEKVVSKTLDVYKTLFGKNQ
jgi:glycosyltransferase involved in cell wall biosynthesis